MNMYHESLGQDRVFSTFSEISIFSSIYSIHSYSVLIFFNICKIQGSLLGIRNIAVNKRNKTAYLQDFTFLLAENLVGLMFLYQIFGLLTKYTQIVQNLNREIGNIQLKIGKNTVVLGCFISRNLIILFDTPL